MIKRLESEVNEMQCGDCGAHGVYLVDGVICEPCDIERFGE